MTISDFPNHPFWDFSVKLYANKNIERILLCLQNNFHLNINMLLYCCWVATNNRGRLNKKQLKQLIDATMNWNRQIVQSLRNIRAEYKKHPHGLAKEISEIIQQVELSAEHCEQLILASTVEPPIKKLRNADQKMLDAGKSLGDYCVVMKWRPDLEDIKPLIEFLRLTFPEAASEITLKRCQQQMIKTIKGSKPLIKQFALEIN